MFIPADEWDERGERDGRWIWALARRLDLPIGEAQHVGLFRRQRPDGAKSDGYRAGDVAAGRRFQIPSDTQQYHGWYTIWLKKPAKVAALMAQWLVNGWCRETIFNLKLPMKKRYEEVSHNLAYIQAQR